MQIEDPNKWETVIQNSSLFLVETSESLIFFFSQGSPELLTVPLLLCRFCPDDRPIRARRVWQYAMNDIV